MNRLIKFIQRLSRFGRIIQFEKPGQGVSDRVSGVPSLEQRMDDVRDAVSSRRRVLLGFSEGCPMGAFFFAATHPERVSHLVLNDGFARSGLAVPDAEFVRPLPI